MEFDHRVYKDCRRWLVVNVDGEVLAECRTRELAEKAAVELQRCDEEDVSICEDPLDWEGEA